MRDRVGIAAAALALLALAAGAVSVRRAREQVSVHAACDAVGRGDYADALARTGGLHGAGPRLAPPPSAAATHSSPPALARPARR